MVCERWCVKHATRASPVPQVPRLPRRMHVDVAIPRLPRTGAGCHTPATQQSAASPAKSQPSAMSVTSAMQSEGRCRQAPRLRRRTHVDVAKCHLCHAKWRGMSPSAMLASLSMPPSATPATQKSAASPATSADQARHKSQPSATSATPATQSEGRCREVPRLPRKVKVDVAKCHACHAK